MGPAFFRATVAILQKKFPAFGSDSSWGRYNQTKDDERIWYDMLSRSEESVCHFFVQLGLMHEYMPELQDKFCELSKTQSQASKTAKRW